MADLNTGIEAQIIANGIDLQRCRQQVKRLKQDVKPYILYLNRLEKRKGPRYLIRAYRRYLQTTEHQPLPLIIAGDGPQAKLLRSDVERFNLEKLVSFEGYVSSQRKWELFVNAQVYVSPAPYGESFGIVLLEAMATQTPFIAGNNEGYQVVAQADGQVSLVNPRQLINFAKTLDRFCNDQALRQRWLTWANEAVEAYDYPRIVDQYEACFKAVMSQYFF